MPTQSLVPFVESPDGLAQDSLISNSASVPGPGSSMTPHTPYPQKAALQSGGSALLFCMFCDHTFTHQDELGPHVLTQHPTSFFEPAVLRVEGEFRIPGERPRPKASGAPVEKEEIHSCIVCGVVSQDAGELETHLRKHKDYFTYCCNVCGRRFREPWFLKNHMKMHIKPGVKGRAQQEQESPATINGVVQDPHKPVVTAYKMCMVCGFFFPDHNSLVEHCRIHNREADPGRDAEDTTESLHKHTFLHRLDLLPRSGGNAPKPQRSSKWIAQLGPYNTYQAWQLATKGKIAVSPVNTKDPVQEASTDNEDCGSDKDDVNHVWSEGDKAGKEGPGRELRSQQQTAAESAEPQPQRRSLMQKSKEKERPTTCEECHRTFRTYHQLVLHSRVHKRELTRAGSVEQGEDGADDDGLEDAALTESFGAGDDGFERSKVRSKECSYCGKSFRSSYYLTVHLRTHTGEKPYKCAYCDYAAAQKTSLKYHLDRRHKDKPFTEIPSRPVTSPPPPKDGKHDKDSDTPAPSRPSVLVPAAPLCTNDTPEDSGDSAGSEPDKPLVHTTAEDETGSGTSARSAADNVLVKFPVPVNLKLEETEAEESEAPLNLSLKVSLSIGASAEPRTALIHAACSMCAYKTVYPELLIMHEKLSHKEKRSDSAKNGFAGSGKRKRLTGCPPALEGKDVPPLPAIGRSHPRRTKSPPPQPVKPQEGAQGQRRCPTPAPVQDDAQRQRQSVEPHVSQDPSSARTPPQLMRKSNVGSKYVMDRAAPLERGGMVERCYPGRSGVLWSSDTARLCLSRRFGTLPQLDFSEPPNKMLKYSLPAGREADAGDKAGFRGPAGGGSNRLLISARSVKSAPQGPCPSTVAEVLGPVKSATSRIAAGLDSEWGMMNLLHPYAPADLATLYHSAPAGASHSGLAPPRAGGRTVLYQHLPSLPSLQRRDPPGPFPHQPYGTSDKTT